MGSDKPNGNDKEALHKEEWHSLPLNEKENCLYHKYECVNCEDLFINKNDAIEHCNLNPGHAFVDVKSIFICTVCKQKFIYRVDVDEHFELTGHEFMTQADYNTSKNAPQKRTFETGAVRSTDNEGKRFSLLEYEFLEAGAKGMAHGEKKYDAHNFKKGIPVSIICDHAIAHLQKFANGSKNEEDLNHTVANLNMLCWTIKNKPEMDDRYDKSKKS